MATAIDSGDRAEVLAAAAATRHPVGSGRGVVEGVGVTEFRRSHGPKVLNGCEPVMARVLFARMAFSNQIFFPPTFEALAGCH